MDNHVNKQRKEDPDIKVGDLVTVSNESQLSHLPKGRRKLDIKWVGPYVVEMMLDESINLCSAIQLTGYPSVVGTLWQATDRHSAEVARDVYSWMSQGGDTLDSGRSAEGLHRAIGILRDKTSRVPGFARKVLNDPLVWASYIHL